MDALWVKQRQDETTRALIGQEPAPIGPYLNQQTGHAELGQGFVPTLQAMDPTIIPPNKVPTDSTPPLPKEKSKAKINIYKIEI